MELAVKPRGIEFKSLVPMNKLGMVTCACNLMLKTETAGS